MRCVSLTGFSLVGGPAYNDAQAPPRTLLAALDVPYIAAHPARVPDAGTMGGRRARPAAGGKHHDGGDPRTRRRHLRRSIFGGRSSAGRRWPRGVAVRNSLDMHVIRNGPASLAARVARLVALRRTARAERKIAVVLFNFPPNAGTVGTAAFLSVFASLHQHAGGDGGRGIYVEVPAERRCVAGAYYSTATPRASAPTPTSLPGLPVDDHVRDEALAGRDRGAMGAGSRAAADRRRIACSCSASGSAMCSSAFSRHSVTKATRCACCSNGVSRRRMRSRRSIAGCAKDFGADAVLHFGTHGALEFMPGKQVGHVGRPAGRTG